MIPDINTVFEFASYVSHISLFFPIGLRSKLQINQNVSQVREKVTSPMILQISPILKR